MGVQGEAVCMCGPERNGDRKEGSASYVHVGVCLCVCCEGLNESQCAHMGRHK